MVKRCRSYLDIQIKVLLLPPRTSTTNRLCITLLSAPNELELAQNP